MLTSADKKTLDEYRESVKMKTILEQYYSDSIEYGCGYWSVCRDHDCQCHPTSKVMQGFDIDVWERMKHECW